jgi:DsbC/DsbD-like thiol-disulfide interchange protein
MKKIILTICLLLTAIIYGKAQILTPVKWSYAAKKINATEAVVFLKATIDDGWHIYSVHQEEGGPLKTTITFDSQPDVIYVGEIIEPKPIIKREEVFKMDVHFFNSSVIFQQKIKLKGKETIIKGKVAFMACNDRECLPPDEVNFKIPVK